MASELQPVPFSDDPREIRRFLEELRRELNGLRGASGGASPSLSHTALADIGTYTHPQIDSHINDGTIHFTMLDEDDMVSNSATQAATQQSIKAYVDAAILAEDFWQRSGTTISPQNAGDSLSIDGAFTANSTSHVDGDVIFNFQSSVGYTMDVGLEYHLWTGDWESDQFKYLNATTGANNCFFVGDGAGSATNTAEGNVCIGKETGNALTTGANNYFSGIQNGRLVTTGTRNVGIGFRSLFNNVTGSNNVGIGYNTLYTATGSYNVGVGANCMPLVSTGQYNVVMGSDSATIMTTGSSNFILGNLSAQALVAGNQNVIIGADAMRTAHNKNNTVGIGWQAGRNANTASSVLLGREAGYSETTDQRLHIANTQTESLIYGEFDTRLVEINGVFNPEGYRETTSNLSTSTTLTHTITYARQTASGITTTLWSGPNSGDCVTIRNRSGGSTTISGNGTNIEGSATITLYDGESADLTYDGTEWTV